MCREQSPVSPMGRASEIQPAQLGSDRSSWGDWGNAGQALLWL